MLVQAVCLTVNHPQLLSIVQYCDGKLHCYDLNLLNILTLTPLPLTFPGIPSLDLLAVLPHPVVSCLPTPPPPPTGCPAPPHSLPLAGSRLLILSAADMENGTRSAVAKAMTIKDHTEKKPTISVQSQVKEMQLFFVFWGRPRGKGGQLWFWSILGMGQCQNFPSIPSTSEPDPNLASLPQRGHQQLINLSCISFAHDSVQISK